MRNKEFAYKLKWLRKHYGVSQETLASTLGVGKSAISNYENGVSMPDSEKLMKIADCFNVSVDLLLGRDNKVKDSGEAKYVAPLHIPVLESIDQSLPSYSVQTALGYMELPEDLIAHKAEFFALKIKDDSLSNLKINRGDIVIVKIQPTVLNGELCVFLVENKKCCVARFNNTSLVSEFNNTEVYDVCAAIISIICNVVKAIINL